MDIEIKKEDIEFHSSNFEKEFPQYVNDLKKYKIEYISCSIRTVLYEGADEYFTTTSVILGTNRKKCYFGSFQIRHSDSIYDDKEFAISVSIEEALDNAKYNIRF